MFCASYAGLSVDLGLVWSLQVLYLDEPTVTYNLPPPLSPMPPFLPMPLSPLPPSPLPPTAPPPPGPAITVGSSAADSLVIVGSEPSVFANDGFVWGETFQSGVACVRAPLNNGLFARSYGAFTSTGQLW